MGLNVSLMAVTSAIMAWVIRTENGGVMNFLFSVTYPSQGGDPEFEINNDLQQHVMDYFMNALLLRSLDLKVLQALPESMGGGKSGVDESHAHPNREPTIFWLTVSLFLLTTILIVILQIMTCCCCCLSSSGGNIVSSANKAVSNADFSHKSLVFRVLYIATLVITLTFLAAAIVLVIVYFSATAMTISYLESHPQTSSNESSTSLPDGLSSVTKHLEAFLRGGVNGGQTTTTDTINIFKDRTNMEIENQLGVTVDKVLMELQVDEAVKKGNSVSTSLNTFIMQIQGNAHVMASVKAKMDEISRNLDTANHELNNAFSNINSCDNQPDCKNLKDGVQNLKPPIASGSIDTQILTGASKNLNDVNTKLKDHLSKISKTVSDINVSTGDMVKSIMKEMNIDSVLGIVGQFWTDVQNQGDSVISQVSHSTDQAQQYLTQYIPYTRILFYIIGGIFIFLVGLATIVAIVLLYQAIGGRLFSDSIPDSVEVPNIGSFLCSKGSICCCSALFIPLLLIFTILIAVLLFVLSIALGEGCIYLFQDSAINKTDYVLNSIMRGQWNSFTSGSLGQIEYISAPPPKDLLKALNLYCDVKINPDSKGLLRAVGYTNLINVEKFVNSKEINDGIESGKKTVMENIDNVVKTSNLPDDATIGKLKTELEGAVNSYDLKATLTNINPNKLNEKTLSDYLKKLEEFSKTNPNINSIKSAIMSLKQVTKGIEDMKPDLNGLYTKLEGSQLQIANLQTNFGDVLTAVHSSISNINDKQKLTATVTGEYDKTAARLKVFLTTDGEKQFANMTDLLFPCSEANMAYTSVVGTTCGDSGGIKLLLALSYVLALNVLFIALLYFSLLVLAFSQHLRMQMLGREVDGLGDFGGDIDTFDETKWSDIDLNSSTDESVKQ